MARLVFTKLQYATFSFCFSYVHFLCLLVQQRSSGQSICCYMKSPFYESIKNIKYERVQQRSHKPILCLTPSANCTKLGTKDSGNICISLHCGHSPAPLSFRQVPVGENECETQGPAHGFPSTSKPACFFSISSLLLFVLALISFSQIEAWVSTIPHSLPSVCNLQALGSLPDGPMGSG